MSQANTRITSVNHPAQGDADVHEPIHPENLHGDLVRMRELAQAGGDAKTNRTALAELARMLGHLETVIGKDAAAAAEVRKPEPLQNVRNDLENIQADLSSHSALLNFLGDCQGTDAGEQTLACAFYALANAAAAIKGGLGGIVRRLMDLEDRPPNVTEIDLQAMVRRAWQERGIVILWPERISNDRQRSTVLNLATSFYGPRETGPTLTVRIERLAQPKRAARKAVRS